MKLLSNSHRPAAGLTINGYNPDSEDQELIIQETPLQGAFIIRPEKLEDERGFFARVYCKKEVAKYGLSSDWVQSNIFFN